MKTRSYIRRMLPSSRSRWAAAWLLCCLLAGLSARYLAGDLPLFARVNSQSVFPAFHPSGQVRLGRAGQEKIVRYREVSWHDLSDAWILWPPVPYSPGSTDLLNTGFVRPWGRQAFRDETGAVTPMPLRFRHWLGTTQTGNDVLSGLLHGTGISLGIGLFSVLLAGLLGVVLGAIGGYSGDRQMKLHIGTGLLLVAGLIPAWFYGFTLRSSTLADALGKGWGSFCLHAGISLLLFGGVLLAFVVLGQQLSRLSPFRRRIRVPVDVLLSRLTEVFASLPRLILIITLSALARPSLLNLIVIFALTGWTDIARIVRAEMLKIRESDYIRVAVTQGLSPARILFRHALPNSIQPALVAMLFGVSGVILAESSLSFLGIGVPFDTVTWGSLIASGKENFSAWWLVLFPGLAIFLTVASLNVLAEEWNGK
jgi:peptide/nickel transport system permease protein